MSKEINSQRTRILSHLSDIGNIAILIQEEMQHVPRDRRGCARRSLKPHNGQYIIVSDEGFTARYKGPDNKWYEANFYRREE